MNGIFFGCLVALGLCGLGCAVRLVTATTVSDRLLALDLLLVTTVMSTAVEAARTKDAAFVDLLVLAALVAFIGTVSGARYIEQRRIQ